jgi:hypothetical protein
LKKERNVVVVGNPCRVLRKITERDKEYYYKIEELNIIGKVLLFKGKQENLPFFSHQCLK